ncbi:ATP-dependent RNA helicase DDX1 [Myotis brandtii]|uniref:ATP-dependent RNA helicase n=1 Tax=Myotis brandtii TaxID=109478 RepID=S7P4L9_MYOBR|nr:ATP-dependent RNA helicase DDX1 [Myotis brandtii]
MAAFSEMGVMPEIAHTVEEMVWLLPTDIQAESIPLILGGGDVLMAAETGSGKTGAFSIPVIQIVYETLKDQQEGKKGKTTIKTGASVLNKWQMNPYDRGCAFAIGSDGLRCQSREVKERHGCRATKGLTKGKHYYEVSCHDQGLCRVRWSSMQASLDLGTDKFGFGFGGTGKKSHKKQFDNYGEEFTMHDTIGCYLHIDKGHVKFSKNGKDLGLAFEIPPHMKNQALFPACVLKNAELKFNFGEEEFKFPPKDGFVGPDKKGHQFSCVCLHGDRKPHDRKQNLERFKKGDVRFLICTDVAARGIDIHGVPYVINVTLPDEKQNYVHRIGHVGRAERMGLAISLVVTEKEKVWYHVCSSRGKGCYNTRLKEDGGCTIWYNEMQLLSEAEEHLNCTISQVEDIKGRSFTLLCALCVMQVETIKAMWMFWHLRFTSWLPLKRRRRRLFCTLATFLTSCSEPSDSNTPSKT